MVLQDVCCRLILYFLLLWPWIWPLLQAALIPFTKELFRIQRVEIAEREIVVISSFFLIILHPILQQTFLAIPSEYIYNLTAFSLPLLVTSWYKPRERFHQKRKLQATIFDEYRCKTSQQNISKLNPKTQKNVIHYNEMGFIPSS